MRRWVQAQSVLIVAAIVLLGACDSVKEVTGQTKRSPDEFAVYSRAPLTLPPNYRLRPPTPGSGPTNVNDPSERAKAAILGAAGKAATSNPQAAAAAAVSPGLQALLRQTGALETDPNIRATINRETSIMATSDKSFTEKMMFWDKTADKASVVDPKAEAKRIQGNKALGKPITDGDVPTIKRKEKGLLEDLF